MRRPSRLIVFFLALLALAAPPARAKLADADWTKAKNALNQAFAQNDSKALCDAVKAVAQDNTRRAVELLIAVGVSDKLEDLAVYDAVRESLAAMTEPEATAAVLDLLEKKKEARDWALRCVICDALAIAPWKEATPALCARLHDKVPYVISAAAKALGKRNDKQAVPFLIERLSDLEKNKDVAWIDVRQALTAITGHDYETAKEWQGYWAAKGATFDPEKDRGEKQEATTELRDEPKFFNEPIVSKRIMFVIDVSGSMAEQDIPVENTGKMKRIDVVKKELSATVKGLKSDVRFNIIAFSHQIKAWRPSKQGLQPATSENKADALGWIAGLAANGATQTDDALKEAFANIDVNTIVLLSDGQPTRALSGGRGELIDPRKILDQVKVWNRLRNVKIHTFCFKIFETMPPQPAYQFDPKKCLEFLEELATENGGKLTKV
jgi:hypothetical protein